VSATVVKGGASVRVVLWTLLIVYIFNFLDRQIVNILAEPIKRDLGLSDTEIGLMTGLAFALFYTVLGIPIARYADRPSTHRPGLIALALALWSAMTVLCGLAHNFVQLLLARIGVGVGEAGCTPAAHSLITDTVPPAQRASAISFYGLGIPIGALLGMVIGGALNDAYGWRTAFVVVGVPGILLAIVVMALIREPRRAGLTAATTTPPPIPLRDALRAIAGSRAFLLIAIASSVTAFLAYGKTVWATIYFIRSHGLSPGETGFWLGITIGVAGMIGTWAGGWLADRLGAADKRHMLTAPALGMAIAAPLLFLAYVTPGWQLAIALLFVPTVLNSFYYGPTYACVQSLVEPRVRAVASAVMLFAQNLIGLGLGPLVFGMLSDGLRPIVGEGSVQWVLFGAAWLGLVPAYFFWRASLRLNAEIRAG
jgi:predicted MFS family arabinose efflux permease